MVKLWCSVLKKISFQFSPPWVQLLLEFLDYQQFQVLPEMGGKGREEEKEVWITGEYVCSNLLMSHLLHLCHSLQVALTIQWVPVLLKSHVVHVIPHDLSLPLLPGAQGVLVLPGCSQICGQV